MSDRVETPVALYFDEECTDLIPQRAVDGETMWVLDFGRVDAGTAKISNFYVRNLSDGVVEDLEISVSNPLKEGVKVEMMSHEYIAALVPGAIHEVQLKWTASEDVKFGECKGKISIEGKLTVDTLHYPER